MLDDELMELNPNALMADGFEDAWIGFTLNSHHAHVAVYDWAKCVQILMDRDDMSEENAIEFINFNTLDAYVGDDGPLFMRAIRRDEIFGKAARL